MSLHHLVLLRHGETDWNAQQRMQGHIDIPLNDTGRAQARAAAPSVAGLRADVVVSSDLSRARETAAAVVALTGQALPVDQRLRETSLGDWQGLTRAEVVATWPGEWEKWRTTTAHYSPPGGESRWQVAQRAAAVVDELDESGAQRGLLVSHGGLIVGLTGYLLGLPPTSWGSLVGITNCHWVVLHRLGEAWRLHSYNAGLTEVVLPADAEEVAGV